MTPMVIRGGDLIDLDAIDPATFTLDMVCHSLAGTERYNSQAGAWTVAEHVLCVAALICSDLESWKPRSDVLDATHAGLCHDNGEAIYGDVIRPLAKYMGTEFKALVSRVDVGMDEAFNVKPFDWHPYDLAMLEAERLYFFPKSKSKPWQTSGAFPARLLDSAGHFLCALAEQKLGRGERQEALGNAHEAIAAARGDKERIDGLSATILGF